MGGSIKITSCTLKNILLYLNTLKYLRPVQIYGRLFSIIYHKIFPEKHIEINENLIQTSLFDPITSFIFHEPWNEECNLKKGEFIFLNVHKNIGFPPKWDTESDLLWKFNLHYFNWLHLLSKNDQDYVIDSWIEKNTKHNVTEWHPYVISLRIVAWCKCRITEKKHLNYLFQQAYFLYNNLEYYHPANHYIENARALIFAGVYFSSLNEGKKWIKKGLQILEKELPNHVLSDGAYFELSPMYHCIILEGLLDIINILPNEYDSKLLKYNINIMCKYLSYILNPDKSIPLLNDSTTEIAPNPEQILNYAKRLHIYNNINNAYYSKSRIQKSSGIYKIVGDNIALIIDGGEIGPDNIPAHSHADIFTYELFIKGQPFIVDTGVFEYNKGVIRDYCRSTKAHNCITIDGKDQAEIWGSFRVGRRYKPKDIKYEESENKYIFSGKFNGYSKLIGDHLSNSRIIEYDKKKKIITINDQVMGKGDHLTESHIHFHPKVKIVKIDQNNIILSLNNDNIQINTNIPDYKLSKSFYSPRFGEKIENIVLILFSDKVPNELTYSISIIIK